MLHVFSFCLFFCVYFFGGEAHVLYYERDQMWYELVKEGCIFLLAHGRLCMIVRFALVFPFGFQILCNDPDCEYTCLCLLNNKRYCSSRLEWIRDKYFYCQYINCTINRHTVNVDNSSLYFSRL